MQVLRSILTTECCNATVDEAHSPPPPPPAAAANLLLSSTLGLLQPQLRTIHRHSRVTGDWGWGCEAQAQQREQTNQLHQVTGATPSMPLTHYLLLRWGPHSGEDVTTWFVFSCLEALIPECIDLWMGGWVGAAWTHNHSCPSNAEEAKCLLVIRVPGKGSTSRIFWARIVLARALVAPLSPSSPAIGPLLPHLCKILLYCALCACNTLNILHQMVHTELYFRLFLSAYPPPPHPFIRIPVHCAGSNYRLLIWASQPLGKNPHDWSCASSLQSVAICLAVTKPGLDRLASSADCVP